MKRLAVSVSGGETSGRMVDVIERHIRGSYDEVVYLMANTSQENQATLDFAKNLDDHYGLGIVLLEAKVNPENRKGTTHTVVGWGEAHMNGEVFEKAIDKYGIPNQAFPMCSRELKVNPMRSYLRSIGWKANTYHQAIGYRADEIDRVPDDYKERGMIFPLINPFPHTKQMVNEFWAKMPFRLELKGYEGNCKWCWKKTLRKHLTIISENPSYYDFPERMEREKADCGAGDGGRVFFRGNTSTQQLRELASKAKFEPFHDDAREYQVNLIDLVNLEKIELDVGGDCNDSCEALL